MTKEFNVLQRNGMAYIISPDRVTKMLLKYGCPEKELWLIEDSTIEAAENFYGLDTIMDLTHDKDYMRCIYHHENGSITYFAGYNTNKEFRKACIWLANQLKG